MNKLLKPILLLISFLAVVRIAANGVTPLGLIEEGSLPEGLSESVFRLLLAPLPISDVWVLVGSLVVLCILFFIGPSKRSRPKPTVAFPIPSPEPTPAEPQPSPPLLPTDSPAITQERVKEEWNGLDEADKETIREMVVQGGLWESDIIALLQVRGFLYHNSRYDSLADRVTFVQCDYTGYHSILPEYQALLEGVLAADYAEDSFRS